MKVGNKWKKGQPNGHRTKMNNLKNGIRNDIKDFIKCINDCDSDSGSSTKYKIPDWVNKVINRPIPVAAPQLSLVDRALISVPGSDLAWIDYGAAPALGVGLVFGVIGTGGAILEYAPAAAADPVLVPAFQ